jgi:hypothetical protein
MAAGLGFKDFTTGEVLTAADVDGYLMQGIWVFASTAARDAAVTAPAEGNFAFTKDTNSLWYYDGAAWVASGATGDIEGVTAGVGISGGGTSGTVTVTNSMATAIDAKGDLVVGTGADTFSRLAVGTNTYVLTADSAEATGLKWVAPSGGSTFVGVQVTKTANTSVGAGANAQIPWDSEAFDTNGFHDNVTNNARLTVPSGQGGYYTVYFAMQWASSSTVARRIVAIYKNGNASTGTFINNFETSSINFPSCAMSFTINLAAADWLEIDAYQGTASALDFRSSNAIFGMEKIG